MERSIYRRERNETRRRQLIGAGLLGIFISLAAAGIADLPFKTGGHTPSAESSGRKTPSPTVAPATTTTTTRPKSTTNSANHNAVKVKIEPQPAIGRTDDYLSCYDHKVTVNPGDTFYGLTTVGLISGGEMTDKVYLWNISNLANQASKNPALNNPNNLSVGQTFSILNDCVEYGGMAQFIDYGKHKGERQVEYQAYKGTDHKVHNDVTADYITSTNGQLQSVYDCSPAPECYQFVADAPKAPKY